jgi:ankyrin repeat protein
VKRKNIDVVRYLVLKCGYKLDVTKHNGVTALGIAAYKGYIGILQELFQQGA